MDMTEDIIRNATEESPAKVDWTEAWNIRYPVLKTYQMNVDIPGFAEE